MYMLLKNILSAIFVLSSSIFYYGVVLAEAECTKSVIILNKSGEKQFGSIDIPPSGSDYSVWSPIVPQAITVDSKGNIYIGDSVNYRIIKFDKYGKYLCLFKLQPPIREKHPELSHVIEDMATDKNDNLYVINLLEYRIEKYSPEGEFIRTIDYFKDSLGSNKSLMYQPSNISIDDSGNIYLFNLDRTCNGKPSGGIYSPSGKLIKKEICVTLDGRGKINYNEKSMVNFSGYYYEIESMIIDSSTSGKRIIIINYKNEKDQQIKSCIDINIEDVGYNNFKIDMNGNIYTFDYNTLNILKINPNIK